MKPKENGNPSFRLKTSTHVPTPNRLSDSSFGKEAHEEKWADGVAGKFTPKDPWYMRIYWQLAHYFNPRSW